MVKIELSRDILLQAATEAARHSYSPYSNFPVGAAVWVPSGEIFTGANIENASYPLSQCAERVAIQKAISEGHTRIGALAVNCLKGDISKPNSLMPCGGCRQVATEFMDEDAPVFIGGLGRIFTVAQLLPEAFILD